ncbi:translocation/assembly module TamB domain-containing protein [Stakelama marina]|uniref:Translocation/assembly module TamB domain-containing protein n=1 Tax=Stakelama marina TaxID=2826939 RepID=A0A8T4IAG8_9SPHN|nr:translocation/assembly module TamB domain-containing protein [Stakelama marina]MBR0551361.1 translocation/assembly module TamB domain-containing protein [Stakelama marina]
MAEDTTPEDTPAGDEVVVVTRRPLWQRIAKWFGIALAGLALLVVLLFTGLNTDFGKRFIADKIGGITTASGLNVKVGRIDGSIYGRMILRDVRVRDPKGVFLSSPKITLDWRPFAYVNNHIDVRELSSPLVRLDRLPQLKSTGPSNKPLLPNIDIDVNKLAIDRIDIGAPVTGQRHIARVSGQVHIADRRAQILAHAATLRAQGVAGGDRLALKLDAVPDANRLDIDMQLRAPRNGLIGGLAKLDAPLALSVEGQGSWQAWNGRVNGTLGGKSLANLRIAEQNGTFQVRGDAHPGLYLKGPVERLTSPKLAIALDATLDQRKADTRLRLRSDAFSLSTRGLIDLANNRFGDFRAEALLLKPALIAPKLRGRSVRAALALNGPFKTPTVDYKIQAGAIGFGNTVVEQLYAEGQAKVDANHILIPVNARARAVTGLNAAAGGLLHNVRINGDLAINGSKVLSDNLRLRSDNIDATAIVVADTATGRYTGALKGRVNDYRVDSIGILNLQTDADLYSAPKGGFGIRGRVVARTQRIFNNGARNFLGGNAYARVDVDYTPAGVIKFSNLRVNAPDFHVTSGAGQYDPAGPLLVNADAYSKAYGPLHARVSGSLTAPVVLLRAPRPGLGVGLVDLEARVRGKGGAYAVSAKGGTNYGPFNADLLVQTGKALSVDIRSGRFAGMDLKGRVQQTGAGPFVGRVDFAGSGVNGQAQLSAAGQYQRADIKARASNAKIPGAAGMTIGRAIIDATATLYPKAPEVQGDAQIANFEMGKFVIAKARAKVKYRGGNGTAQLVANGSSGVPFELAANARLNPDDYLVALKGSANGIGFKTADAMRIRKTGGSYQLLPTRIDLDKGAMRIAGTYGNGMSIQTRLDKLDLSVVNAFVPDLGIGGTATGSLDFAKPSGASFPKADARLNIANFQRSSIATVSKPVNIEFVGKLLPDGGDARALVKRGTTTVGRMVATLRPLPPGAGSWVTRLMSAPLSGGIRYNGPSGVLFSFAGFADQQMSGPIAVAADFGGRVQSPQLTGIVHSSGLTYQNETYGTRLTNMKIDGRFTNDRFELNQLTANAGDGTIEAQGHVGLSSNAGFPIDIVAKLDDARLAKSDGLGATATGQLRVQNDPGNSASITGDLTIPEARYKIIRQGSAEVPELTGVRRKGQKPTSPDQSGGLPGLFKLNIRIHANDRLYVSGMGLESEWQADLRVRGTSANPRVSGTMQVVRGTYSFAGKRFELNRGVVSFEGGAISNPQLNIQATTTAEGITAILNITGSAQNPQIAFTSTPALPQEEVVSRLLFGSSVTNLSATQAIQLAAALNSLRGSGGGLNPLGKLRSATGIDRLRILGSDQASGRGTALAAGKYLTDNIYVEIITDAKGFTATQLEISLTKALSILSHTSSFGGSGASIRYSKDY